MAMKSRASTSFVMFDVVYEDGTRSSNRKVSATALAGLAGDEPARGIIEAQDREIAAASGRPRSNVKSIIRSPIKVAEEDAGADRKVRGAKREGPWLRRPASRPGCGRFATPRGRRVRIDGAVVLPNMGIRDLVCHVSGRWAAWCSSAWPGRGQALENLSLVPSPRRNMSCGFRGRVLAICDGAIYYTLT